MIRYEIFPESPEAHLYRVTLSVDDPDASGQRFYLPAWIRGSYLIRDFSRHIVSLDAQCADQLQTINKLDKQTWQISPCQGELTLTYYIYAWDLSVRGAHLDTTHAYFNGPCVFLAVNGKEHEPCELTITLPRGKTYLNWRVATAMPARSLDAQGVGVYRLPDYEALLDHPVEIGEFQTLDFAVAETTHRIVVSGRHNTDIARLVQDLQKICAEHVGLFGELPVEDYLFLLWVVGEGYGGLEHRNSTSLMCSRDDLPYEGMQELGEGYRRLLGLCSHEYFHLWNVKRIMPKAFQAAGTQQEVYTRQLWVFEGITSYYDDLALARTGVIDKNSYFVLLAENISRVMRGSGRLEQTLEESSFDTWSKFYKQDENAPNAIVSYYAKGALFALYLDLHIRAESDGAMSLDDVMRSLWQQFGKTGLGVPEGGFERMAMDATGLRLAPLFEQGLRSTEDLPLAPLFNRFGVEMRLLPARTAADKGRVVDAWPETAAPRPVLGARTTAMGNEIRLLQVFKGGAAQAAGLSAGDVIVAVDGLRLSELQLEQQIARRPLGDRLRIHVFRRDELMEFELKTMAAPADTCVFLLPQALPEKQAGLLAAWLHADVPA